MNRASRKMRWAVRQRRKIYRIPAFDMPPMNPIPMSSGTLTLRFRPPGPAFWERIWG